MDRVIEFKAWHTDAKLMLYGTPKEVFQWVEDGQPVIPLQFTGLLDKNGKEIYENDVVEGQYYKHGIGYFVIGRVEWVISGFIVVGIDQYSGVHAELNSNYEIIGNIYENPDLLK